MLVSALMSTSLLTFLIPPSEVLNAFNSKYAKAIEIQWNKTETHYMASFEDEVDSTYKTAIFNMEGTWTETYYEVIDLEILDLIFENLDALFTEVDYHFEWT